MSDRPTLKSLSEQLDNLSGTVARLRQPEDAEAQVIAQCAKALDGMMKSRNERGSNATNLTIGYGSSFNYPHHYDLNHPVARVLDYLRQRHGLPNPAAEVERLRLEVQELRERLTRAESRTAAVRQAMDGAS